MLSSGWGSGKRGVKEGVHEVDNKDEENTILGARSWVSEIKVSTPLFGKTFVSILGAIFVMLN